MKLFWPEHYCWVDTHFKKTKQHLFQDACEYREDDEQVDIETVEELSEKINIARLKATAAHIEPSDQK